MKLNSILLIVVMALVNRSWAGNVSAWPFNKNTRVFEFTVIYMSPLILVERGPTTPDILKRKYSHLFTNKLGAKTDPLVQNLAELVAVAKPIKSPHADFRWGITIVSKQPVEQGVFSEQFFLAWTGREAIASIDGQNFKLDSEKARSFLSQFNGVFGCAIQ